jgi:hypothetical protein
VGQDIRSLCIGLVYRKVAALSVADLTAGAGGMDVPSLVGSDVQKVPLFLPTATLLWAAPLQVKTFRLKFLWIIVGILTNWNFGGGVGGRSSSG